MKNNKVKKQERSFNIGMQIQNNMNKLSNKNVFFILAAVVSIVLIIFPSEVYAEKIEVNSEGVDKTTIITVTNTSTDNIKTIRIWLSENFNFETFKTEKGWLAEKTPQGVIIFTSLDTIKTNESIKFGIKTDQSNPIINWKALDEKENVIQTGVVTTNDLSTPIKNLEIELEQNMKESTGEIFSDSTFKIIPDKPNSGSTIRVTGEGFGVSQVFDFYINTEKIGNFETDENGFFITTMQIPEDQINERVDFKIKNQQGDQKIVSLRLGEKENRETQFDNMKLSVDGISNIIYRGEQIKASGTAVAGTAITLEITNSEKIVTNTRVEKVDNRGNWKLSNPISLPYDAPVGKYSIVISDGRNQMMKNWIVETDKVIIINPTQIKFNPGELIKFNGTALPEIPLQLILEDSLGNEIMSEVIEVDKSGFIEFEYQSVENDDIEGTWTLIATQKQNKEFTYVGYDVMPEIPVNIEFDKTNYRSNEIAEITLVGKPYDKIKLIIISPSGSIIGEEIQIQLREDGREKYELELGSLSAGIHTAVIQKGNSQNSERFSVGLTVGSGKIEIQTTQTEYELGERILLLGKTNPHALMIASLVDPSGKKVRTLEIPSNNEGVFTEDKLRIPTNGMVGKWKININSGSNLSVIEFEVTSPILTGISVKVVEDIEIPGFGKNIKIGITTDHKTSVTIVILDQQQNVIDKTLTCNTTTDFKCEIIWTVTKDLDPGTYIVRVNDASSSDETTFTVERN